ncbi:hypothetical protein [Cohnella terricola]|uniref:Uncharacterized protein n=1 Tax=Cohnella terricola TaxID=1289167 RepID=A0A559JN01_9BACL|nr:hypothetical protein [Cohnella terricola]TVY01246.1 hypothetical protein FPZ45_08850 [Cohnella terricola]
MTIGKKIAISVMAVSTLATTLAEVPLNRQSIGERYGWTNVANAEQTPAVDDSLLTEEPPVIDETYLPGEESVIGDPDLEVEPPLINFPIVPWDPIMVPVSALPSGAFLDRMNELYAALIAGDPADVQDVRNLRDEIAGLDETANLHLIDPIWNKISAKLPPSVDQTEMKASLFRLVKAVGSIRYDAGASDLEAIRTNPEFRAVMKTIAAAAGENIQMDDFLVFMFGDGGSRKGVEGTIADLLAGKSSMELLLLLGNKQGIVEVLLQATERLLNDTNAYTFSSILQRFGVTPQDVRSTVLNFQAKLKTSQPAINAMTVAYIRSAAKANAKISLEGRMHEYTLSVYGVEVPSLVLQWTKVSGSPDVKVLPNGIVTLADTAANASVVIQARLMNPLGGSSKVIFEKEVTLTAEVGEESHFPVELFLERMSKVHAALAAGDPSDLESVRQLRAEIVGLDLASNEALIAPVWNKIASKLPASADQQALKAGLFEIMKAIAALPYDPDPARIEAIRTNPEFRATLKAIGTAGGERYFVIDDLLIYMFGDFDTRQGAEGLMRNKLAGMTPSELAGLLGDKQGFAALLLQAAAELLSDTGTYKTSSVAGAMGITAQDIGAAALNFQLKLPHAEAASLALTVAYLRSETEASVVVSEDGQQLQYGLKVFGIELPADVLEWSKVSGSPLVNVEPNGTVWIADGVDSASAVIRAKLVGPNGGIGKTIFEQEVTLTAKETKGDVFPVEQYLKRMAKIREALTVGDPADTKDLQKLRDEIARLDPVKDQALIDPLWKKIAPNLPASVDKTQLKRSLFDIFKAVGSFVYDPEAAELDAIRTNPEYLATLKTIASAAGVKNVSMDDWLIVLFGNGKGREGVDGTIRDIARGMNLKELSQLFGNKKTIYAVIDEAIVKVLSDKEGYAFSKVLSNLGVVPSDVLAVVHQFQNKLKNDEPAFSAMSAAYVRSEAEATVKVSQDGYQHEYGLTFQGIAIPSSSLKWKKVSGSKDIKVNANGTVTLAKKALQGTAIIQASLVNPFGGKAKVVFEREISLGHGPEEQIRQIIQDLEAKLVLIENKLRTSKNDSQKVKLILDAIQAGNQSADAVKKVNISNEAKEEAINEIKSRVQTVLSLILADLIKF